MPRYCPDCGSGGSFHREAIERKINFDVVEEAWKCESCGFAWVIHYEEQYWYKAGEPDEQYDAREMYKHSTNYNRDGSFRTKKRRERNA